MGRELVDIRLILITTQAKRYVSRASKLNLQTLIKNPKAETHADFPGEVGLFLHV